MATSEVQVCNLALQKLGEPKRIVSLTEDSPLARYCNLAYEPMRDLELRKHIWRFARKRASLAADATSPDFGYDYRYLLPTDCLRLIDPDPADNGNDIDRQIEGRYVLTDEGAPLNIIYIARITDTATFDAAFDEVLACRIALQLCEPVTQSNKKKQALEADYDKAVADARKVNAMESIAQEPPVDSWITGRL